VLRDWVVEDRVGDAASLHATWPAPEAHPERRAVALCRVTGAALVLGSTQPAAIVDPARAATAGVDIARRRSGGGAVLVTPDEPVWIDIWLPTGDPLWRNDVSRAFDWLGDAWVDALRRLGIPGLTARRRGFLSCTQWSSLVCFGGVGTGEVTADDGRKVVGLAQRRNRHGCCFHCACVLRWDAGPLVDVLALSPSQRRTAAADLGGAVVGAAELADDHGSGPVDGPSVAASLIRALPGPASP
jgi:lipoate---protein ligase